MVPYSGYEEDPGLYFDIKSKFIELLSLLSWLNRFGLIQKVFFRRQDRPVRKRSQHFLHQPGHPFLPGAGFMGGKAQQQV
jgi:hypothetical protein